ncbi:MAG TPA: DUF3300 domain-containing protein [Vicinamibacterales bacterium]
MTLKIQTFSRRAIRPWIAMMCALAIGPGDLLAYALPASALPQTDRRSVLSADQLDSLVAPIALYPDPLLAQVLAASTYPAELRELDEWLEENFDLTDRARADAVAQEPWDPSVQAMSAFPDLVKNMTENIHWTTDLGNAVLNQESDVMDAVQRMRQSAQDAGYLSSNAQQVIDKKVVDNRTVITIEPPTPQTVYVPYYNPSMIWGTPVYPWPTFYYAPRRGAWRGAAIGFGTGVAVGSFWGRGGWGWRPAWGWGRNSITVNRNARFVRNNRFYGGRGGRWRHNPSRVGFAPRRGRRAGVVGTTGRNNFNRRNVNRRNVNRRNVNRRNVNRGNVNRGNVNRGNANRRNMNRRNVNRPAGTSGRNSLRRGQARAGTANRANRPIGTSGRVNRGGSRNVRGGGSGRSGGGARRSGGGRRR